MQVVTLAPGQPLPDLLMAVGGVVVQHDVDVKVRGNFPVNEPQEREELLMAVPALTLGDQRLLDLPVRVNYSCRFSGSFFSFSGPVR